VERTHQEKGKEDRRTQGIKGCEAQQTAQFKAEERAMNPTDCCGESGEEYSDDAPKEEDTDRRSSGRSYY